MADAEAIVDSFEALHAAVMGHGPASIYRGVGRASYALIPKVGRTGYSEAGERASFRLFKLHAVPYLEREPSSEWEWLYVAQHHGLATRLLDWTRNPLVAAYFAVEQDVNDDAALYVCEADNILVESEHPDPFKFAGSIAMLPRHINRRIAAQAGVFTVQSEPANPFPDKVVKYVIPRGFRAALRRTLFVYHIHRGTLFPDLDGQASFINWYRSAEGWGPAPTASV